jgi:hypothetical protein
MMKLESFNSMMALYEERRDRFKLIVYGLFH